MSIGRVDHIAASPETMVLEPEVDALPQGPADLRELTESSTSLGSYGLRWQLVVSAAWRDAVL